MPIVHGFDPPERFVAGAPSAGAVPTEVWINKPQQASPSEEARQ